MYRLTAAFALTAALAAAPPAYVFAPEERAFLDLLDKERHPLEAREAAKAYLARHPQSFVAWQVVGSVYFHTDGDLPRALYYYTHARDLLEPMYQARWPRGHADGYFSSVLNNLSSIQHLMTRHEDALRTLRHHDEIFIKQQPEEHTWPLMKLGRYAEARRKIDETLATGNPQAMRHALNTLCSVYSENDQPEEAFATALRIRDLERANGLEPTPTGLRNAAGEAHALGLTARCEQLILEATEHFSPYSVSNPWGDLTEVYLEQQRLPEAMDAVRRMHHWAFRSTALAAETHWHRRKLLTAGLLLRCGATDEALAMATLLGDRPDRQATGSSRPGQREAGTQLFLYQALQDALARDAEAYSYSPWKARPALLLARARHGLAAALTLRRAASLLLASRDRLSHSLRGLPGQNIVVLSGGEALLPRIAGPGVAEAEVRRLLARRGPAADRERGFLLFSLGAARLERGDSAGALEALRAAGAALPAEYATLHTQIQGLRAKALLDRGDLAGALGPLQAVLEKDGGEVRRLGLSLPCRLEATGALGLQAAQRLQASPRLTPGRGGFRLVIGPTGDGGLQGGLHSPQGTLLTPLKVPAGATAEATVLAFCREFHRKAFSPRIELSQQQIKSLEGSTLAAQDAEEQLKGILGGREAR